MDVNEEIEMPYSYETWRSNFDRLVAIKIEHDPVMKDELLATGNQRLRHKIRSRLEREHESQTIVNAYCDVLEDTRDVCKAKDSEGP